MKDYIGEHGEVTRSRPARDVMRAVKRRMHGGVHVVLVADDELPIRKLVVRNLKNIAPRVEAIEAENGRALLDALEDVRKKYKQDPVLIVLDLRMPVMDGWTVIKKLREEYQSHGHLQGIPVIVLSGTSGEKGPPLFKQSVHSDKTQYVPLVTIAKAECVRPARYTAQGEQGLIAWLEHFLANS